MPVLINSIPGIGADLDIRSLFEGGSEELVALTENVIRKCILEKIRLPVSPLQHRWIQPGGPYYLGQWIWDTMFVVDLLSILPSQQQVIHDIFQNYWDYQDRWNQKMPDYARDMITVAIKTAPQEERQFSQIPILAWGVERVYQRNGDKELLKQCLGRLERFHDWYWRERDLHGNGLITLGAYTGKLQHAKWETFDYERNMDGLTWKAMLTAAATNPVIKARTDFYLHRVPEEFNDLTHDRCERTNLNATGGTSPTICRKTNCESKRSYQSSVISQKEKQS